MLKYLSLAWTALKYAPSVFKYIPTALRHAPEVIEIFTRAKELAGKVEAETGIKVVDAVKDILGGAAQNIKKPSEWTHDDRKAWEDRGMSSGH
jgi:hypothetical protein